MNILNKILLSALIGSILSLSFQVVMTYAVLIR